MSLDISGKLADMKQSLVCLKHTKKIEALDLSHPEWAALHREYRQVTDPVIRAVVSILNAVLTQQRVIFVLTRRTVATLVRNDPNWPKNARKFSNKNYRTVLKHLSRFAEMIQPGQGVAPAIYCVSDADLLEHLPRESGAAQYDEAEAFCRSATDERAESGSVGHSMDQQVDRRMDRKLDRKMDQVYRSKHQEERIQDQDGKPVPDPDPSQGEIPGRTGNPSGEQIERLERLINCPGIDRSTRTMLNEWLLPLKRFKNGLTDNRLALLGDIESKLTNQQKRDLATDADEDESDAFFEFDNLVVDLWTTDVRALETAYRNRYGDKRFSLLTRTKSLSELTRIIVVGKFGSKGMPMERPHMLTKAIEVG